MALLGESSDDSPPVDDEDLAQLLEGLGATSKEREEAEIRELLEGLPELQEEGAHGAGRSSAASRALAASDGDAADILSAEEDVALRSLLRPAGALRRNPVEIDEEAALDDDGEGGEVGDLGSGEEADVLAALSRMGSPRTSTRQEGAGTGLRRDAPIAQTLEGDAESATPAYEASDDAGAPSVEAAADDGAEALHAREPQDAELGERGNALSAAGDDDAIEALEAEGEELSEGMDLTDEGGAHSLSTSPSLQVRREALADWQRSVPVSTVGPRQDQIPAAALRIGGEDAAVESELSMPIDDRTAMALVLPPAGAGSFTPSGTATLEAVAEITLELIEPGADAAADPRGADARTSDARGADARTSDARASGERQTGGAGKLSMDVLGPVARGGEPVPEALLLPSDPILSERRSSPSSVSGARPGAVPVAAAAFPGSAIEAEAVSVAPEEPAEPVTFKELFAPQSPGGLELREVSPIAPTFLRSTGPRDQTAEDASEAGAESAGGRIRTLPTEPELSLPPMRDPLAARKAVAGERLDLFMREDVQTLLAFRILRFFVMTGLERIQLDELQEEMVEPREQLLKTLGSMASSGLIILEAGHYSLNTRARKLSLLGTAVAQWQTPRRREALLALLKRP